MSDDDTDLISLTQAGAAMDTLSISGADTITIDSVDFGNISSSTISGVNLSSIGASGASNALWHSTGTYSIGTTDPWQTPMKVSQSGQINISGEDADIVVNGESLMSTIKDIRNRLNLLRPNLELEKEWDELRALGEKYRKLEAEFAEKSKAWATLKG